MTAPIEAMRPHPLLPFPVGVTTGPGKAIVTGDVYLAGWNFRETTGAAAAQVDLIDGNDAGGVLIASTNLLAGESKTIMFGGHLLVVRNGLFVAVNVGTVTGAVYFADRLGAPSERRRHRD